MNFKLNIESPLAAEGNGVFKSGVALNETAQLRATPSQGTSGVVGNCKLAVISESDLESLYSGGKSGTAGVKMSIKEQGWCDVLGHAMKAGFEPPIASQSGIYVLIGVAGKSEQVYISNIVPVEAFKSDLEYPPDEADRIIIALRNLMGARPEGMAPMPVTESLARLTELIGSRPENSTKTVISPFDHVPHY